MKVYLIEKKKYRVYKSEQIVEAILGKKLTHTAKGAPQIDGAYISISDTKSFWGCGVSEDISVGFDIEELTRSVKPNLARHLHEDEIEDLASLAPGGFEWREEFLSIWTKKEAYMKMEGIGLSMGLSSFSVIDNNDVDSFKYQKLMIGVAGDLRCDITWPKYDAPFEISCMDAAAAMLNTRGFSEAELRKKLSQRCYCDEDIDEAIKKLLDYGYLNDNEYAKSLARRMHEAGKASKRIAYELEKKGIDKEIARNAANEYKDTSMESALKIAEKFTIKTEKDLNRLGRKLATLGYEPSLIYDIIYKLKKN